MGTECQAHLASPLITPTSPLVTLTTAPSSSPTPAMKSASQPSETLINGAELHSEISRCGVRVSLGEQILTIAACAVIPKSELTSSRISGGNSRREEQSTGYFFSDQSYCPPSVIHRSFLWSMRPTDKSRPLAPSAGKAVSGGNSKYEQVLGGRGGKW